MTCRELADFIMDYVNGELPGEVKSAFEKHLAVCPNCVNYLATYRTTVDLSRRAFEADDGDPTLQMPEELIRAILDARNR
jgi:anti-sigma factor RsiW